MSGCLSDFALDDRALHGAGDSAAGAHLGTCAACQARLEARRARVVEFETTWQAPTWTRIQAGARSRRRRRWSRAWLLAVPGVALASLVVVPALRRPPEARGPTAKGSALVEIVCRRDGGVFPVSSGDEVAPGDALRFRPLPVWAGAQFIQVGSVDGTGAYVPFYPPADDGVSVPLPPAGAALDGSIRLDEAPGPERLFVVLSPAPIAVHEVARAALAGAATGDRVERIAGTAVSSAWVVLPKRGGTPAGR